MALGKSVLFLLLISTAVAFAGCTAEPAQYTQGDFLAVLETSKDFTDYKADLKGLLGNEPEFELVDANRLDPAKAAEIVASLEASNKAVYAPLYSNLPESSALYVVRMQCVADEKRGLIATLDMENGKVHSFFATYNLST